MSERPGTCPYKLAFRLNRTVRVGGRLKLDRKVVQDIRSSSLMSDRTPLEVMEQSLRGYNVGGWRKFVDPDGSVTYERLR